MGHRGPWYATVEPENNYLYNGKELNEDYGINLMDYGARWYDGALGRWTGVDALSELYYPYSNYSYVLNRPINAKDPDGKLVVFINGFTPSKGNQGTPRYWREYTRNRSILGINQKTGNPIYSYSPEREVRAFDKRVMQHLGDFNATYIHGGNNLSRGSRYADGYMTGVANAEAILNQIIDENGNVTETIKVITHSMGSAFGKGFVKALLRAARKRGVKGVPVTLVADFDPFQAAGTPLDILKKKRKVNYL
ncbi:MAG: hypothetical protein H6566_23630 [Lewinellaceae bacterium]|nr:hypothetical protein [Lewinellaceae bacterium]